MVDAAVREATILDAMVIASKMREADVAEVGALGLTPFVALKNGLVTSTYSRTGTVGGAPVIMFGVSPVSVLTGIGRPWLLGTDEVLKMRRPFIKQCRHYVSEMLRFYPHLINFVDVRNTVSIRWLRWLGFEMSDPVPVGINGELFHPFRKRI